MVEELSGKDREADLIALVRERMSQALHEAETWRVGVDGPAIPRGGEVRAP
jgi:hypothetical protein